MGWICNHAQSENLGTSPPKQNNQARLAEFGGLARGPVPVAFDARAYH
jgi:hypothetical protein